MNNLYQSSWQGQPHKVLHSKLVLRGYSRGRPDVSMKAVEDDPRYRRVDLSELHAFEARKRFARALEKGESGVNLAEAALAIAAEDDALVSHSTVPLPINSFLKRIEAISTELARIHLPALGSNATPEEALQVIEDKLFRGPRTFKVPTYGRTNVPVNFVLDHAGVWENSNQAYLHEVLIRKTGIAATLAIIYSQVVQHLLASKTINFAVRIDCEDWHRLPEAKIIPDLSREALIRPDGTVLNICTTAALQEMLLFLKRAFWPFPWQTSLDTTGQGFTGAAEVALEGEATADLQAISRTAKHRLDRGIWTSTGAGDMRRALAASERICMLAGDLCPWERRDLAVLLLHIGRFEQAASEMEAYMASSHYRGSATAKEVILVEQLHSLIVSNLGDTLAGIAHPKSKVKHANLRKDVDSFLLSLGYLVDKRDLLQNFPCNGPLVIVLPDCINPF